MEIFPWKNSAQLENERQYGYFEKTDIDIFHVLHVVGALKEQVFSYAEHQDTPRTMYKKRRSRGRRFFLIEEIASPFLLPVSYFAASVFLRHTRQTIRYSRYQHKY